MIQKLDWSRENVFAYEASGKMTKEENIRVFNELREGIRKHGKVRILIKMEKMAWPEPGAICERFSFAREHLRDIERYAVVTDIPLVGPVAKGIGLIIGIQFRQYSLDDELLAKTWVMAKHV